MGGCPYGLAPVPALLVAATIVDSVTIVPGERATTGGCPYDAETSSNAGSTSRANLSTCPN
jgi:hypothetical protein